MSSELMIEEKIKNRFKGSIIGLAVGDAYGTTFEFIPRHAIKHEQLLKDDYMGGGKFKLMNGMFTDDTSLALIQSESLLDFYSISKNDDIIERLDTIYRKNEAFDRVDEKCTCIRGEDIINKSLKWYNNGHFAANGSCFDIGATTLKYLLQNNKKKQAFCLKKELHDDASGNGALMRLAPVPLYFYALYLRMKKESKSDHEEYLLHRVIEESGYSSMTTHPSEMSIDCNRYMAALIIGCIQNVSKNELLKPLFVPHGLPDNYWTKYPLRKEVYNIVYDCQYKTAESDSIKNSGFSVKSFESALWAFHKYDSFMEGLMQIVSLGDDCDTVGAIYGQLAGCYYGLENIPNKLVNNCVFSKFIQLISEEILRAPIKIGENSWVYISSMKIFELLEVEYSKIDKKINPSPSQFKNIDQFKASTIEMKKEYNDFKKDILSKIDDSQTEDEIKHFESITESLLNDFLTRCNDYILPKLSYQFQRASNQLSILSQLKLKK